MDFVEGLPRSEGLNTILVVMDKLTKFSYFLGLAHPFTATEVARKLMDSVFKVHGLPQSIVYVRDKIFTSHFWWKLFKNLGVSLHVSMAYHLETDGQTERVNQCLETYLWCLYFSIPKNLYKWLPLVQWWYNTVVQY